MATTLPRDRKLAAYRSTSASGLCASTRNSSAGKVLAFGEVVVTPHSASPRFCEQLRRRYHRVRLKHNVPGSRPYFGTRASRCSGGALAPALCNAPMAQALPTVGQGKSATLEVETARSNDRIHHANCGLCCGRNTLLASVFAVVFRLALFVRWREGPAVFELAGKYHERRTDDRCACHYSERRLECVLALLWREPPWHVGGARRLAAPRDTAPFDVGCSIDARFLGEGQRPPAVTRLVSFDVFRRVRNFYASVRLAGASLPSRLPQSAAVLLGFVEWPLR